METVQDIESYFDRLWPILRSITGEGVRKTHRILSELLPLNTFEIPSGNQVFDWTIPKEWVVREAFVVTPNGERILDVQQNNLHLLNYAVPFRGKVSRAELDKHLHSLPEMPNAIPYVTSYYKERWGFCLAHEQRERLPDGDYEVVVDTEFKEGSLTLSEAVLPGENNQEILVSTYTCHPSMANNELSGPLVAAFLYRRLMAKPRRRFTYRFVFVPETIGAIAYLHLKGEHLLKHLFAGYVVTCAGDPGPFTYKRSRIGNSPTDRAAEHVLRHHCPNSKVVDFFPTGSDERQYCSPGFNLPVGSLMRTMYSHFPEYHTSLDNRTFISFEALQESISIYEKVLDCLEANRLYRRLSPYCEPQLSKRGLYPTVGGPKQVAEQVEVLLWFLNLADGKNELLAIAERSGKSIFAIKEAAEQCKAAKLVFAEEN